MTFEQSSMPREVVLARALIELADTLVDDFDVIDLLTRLVHRCVEVLDVDAAGLLLTAPEGDLRLAASSSETMRLVELFELQAEEGPCLDCYRTGEAVVNLDLTSAVDRWPHFTPMALDVGFRSVHALPLRLRADVIGAVNLFRAHTGPMDAVDVLAGQAMADMATIAILQHRATAESQILNDQLTYALTTRTVIEQAKGVLAERAGLDMHQAFERMRAYARDNNLRLGAVARAVLDRTLDTAALAPDPPPPEARG